jgi:hypothetical protein
MILGMLVEEAAGQIHITRNQRQTGWMFDPGQSRSFIYYPDGRLAQLSWNNSWGYWWQNNPTTVINVYSWLPASRRWALIRSANVDPVRQQLTLFVTTRGAPYLIVVRNIRNGDLVTLRVQ